MEKIENWVSLCIRYPSRLDNFQSGLHTVIKGQVFLDYTENCYLDQHITFTSTSMIITLKHTHIHTILHTQSQFVHVAWSVERLIMYFHILKSHHSALRGRFGLLPVTLSFYEFITSYFSEKIASYLLS